MLKENFIWNSIGNFTYLVCQWLITVLIVRITDYNEAGILSLAMTITNTFYAIASWGVRTYQVSDVYGKYKDSTYISSRYMSCIIAIVSCDVFVLLNAYNVKQTIVIFVYMLFRAIEAYIDVIHGIDQKLGRMDLIGKSFLMRGFGLLAVFTIVLYITKDVLWSVIGITISTLSVCIFYDIPKSRMLRVDKSKTDLRAIVQLLLECIPLVLYIFLMTTVSLVPRYYLEKVLGSELLGIYASISAPAVIVQAASSYIMAPFITPIAELVEEHNYLKYIDLIKKYQR